MGTHPIFESDFDCLTEGNMNYIPNVKVELKGKLIVAIPSEGCLGQRVADQILRNEKSFKFVGSFDHSSLQPMVGYLEDGRLVTCMELYYSENLEIGVIQIRAPPLKIQSFVQAFTLWFNNSGFSEIVATAGVQCSFPIPDVLLCGKTNVQIPYVEPEFLQQSIRRAGFAKCLKRNIPEASIVLSADIGTIEPMVKALCEATNINYSDIMSIEHLQISEIPVGIF